CGHRGSRRCRKPYERAGADLSDADGPVHRAIRSRQRNGHYGAIVRRQIGLPLGQAGAGGKSSGRRRPGRDCRFRGRQRRPYAFVRARRTFTVHPYEHEKLPYDVERDLLPIASVSTIILAVSTSAALKVDSLGELVDLARAQPGKLNAAAANGNADFLLFGFLKSTGLQVAKVPYR